MIWIHGIASDWWGNRNIPPIEGLREIRAIGFDTVQWAIDNAQVCTAPGVYDFTTRFDIEFANFAKLGFKILMKPMWAPSHMSEGKPAYKNYVWGVEIKTGGPNNEHRYADRCRWPREEEAGTEPLVGVCGKAKDDPVHVERDESIRAHIGFDANFIAETMDSHFYVPEKSFAVHPNIPHIDAHQMYNYAVALAEHVVALCLQHGMYVSDITWSTFNELGINMYWPPTYGPGPYEPAYDRFVAEVWIPMVTGVRSVIANAVFIGPEADTPGTLNFFYEAIKRAGAPEPDIPTAHLYPPKGTTFPEGVFTEIERPGGWLTVMRRHGLKKMLNTEHGGTITGDGENTIVSGTRELQERYPWIIGHAPLDHGQWFEGGQPAWNAGQFVRNQTWHEMRTLITGKDALPPPPPPVRVLTEPAYRIVDLERYVTADRVFIDSVYLFIALRYRVPKPIVSYGPALAISVPVWQDPDYMIAPINRSSMQLPGDQYFAIHLDSGNGPPYFGPKMWSELPGARAEEFGLDADGTRRRAARS